MNYEITNRNKSNKIIIPIILLQRNNVFLQNDENYSRRCLSPFYELLFLNLDCKCVMLWIQLKQSLLKNSVFILNNKIKILVMNRDMLRLRWEIFQNEKNGTEFSCCWTVILVPVRVMETQTHFSWESSRVFMVFHTHTGSVRSEFSSSGVVLCVSSFQGQMLQERWCEGGIKQSKRAWNIPQITDSVFTAELVRSSSVVWFLGIVLL